MVTIRIIIFQYHNHFPVSFKSKTLPKISIFNESELDDSSSIISSWVKLFSNCFLYFQNITSPKLAIIIVNNKILGNILLDSPSTTTLSVWSISVISGGIIVGKFRNIDIREKGSNNAGATNALRTGNKLIGYSTLTLDILKAVLPIIFIKINYSEYIYVSSLCVFIGHVFPLWLKFKGGKGVATYLGILFCINVILGLVFIVTWLFVYIVTKYSSLSSIFSSLTVLVVTLFRENVVAAIDPDFIFVSDIKLILFIFLILIIFTHRKNISNLKKRTEQKIKL